MKPVIAIVGKPNVGKSTLFNRLVGKRKALVSKISGLTRDRNYADVNFEGRVFTLVDTGGMEPKTKDAILKEVQRQTQLALFSSDIVLFMVDAKDGLTPTDSQIAEVLRKIEKKVILLVNKVDNEKIKQQIYEFYKLGMGEPLEISATHGLNIPEVFDKITEHMPLLEEELKQDEELIKIAVIGKPNVGKSSLVNALVNEERVIVDEKPGTTRDAIDTFFHRGKDRFILIDTAGIRHKGGIKDICNLLSLLSAQRSIERADVALILLDADKEFSEQDEKIAGLAYEAGCASIIVVNKWDLVHKKSSDMDRIYQKYIKSKFKFLHFAPIIFTSAKTKHGVEKIIFWVRKVVNNYSRNVSSGDLRGMLNEALQRYSLPLYKGKTVKIGYIEQIKTKPPTFKLVTNEPHGIHFSYSRYLENRLREKFDFMGTPIKMLFSKPR